MYRRALQEILRRLPQTYPVQAPLERFQFDIAYERVRATGLPVRDPDDAWIRLLEYRASYATSLQALIDYLLAPPGFWGHSAEDTDAEG